MTIETASGMHDLKLYIRDGKVSSVSADMGFAEYRSCKIPVKSDLAEIINSPVEIAEKSYNITALSVGNPHCVVFCDEIDSLNLSEIGPKFEYADIFPERINTEFVRVINKNTLRMRVWERGNGETLACGTGAYAAVSAACKNGLCSKGKDVTVKLAGGDLIVNYTDEKITLTGNTVLVFEGEFEY